MGPALTDEDGPYIELMCGAYTDNQPDFSWIQPGEEKAFSQVFMPYKEIGPACNANQDAALSLYVEAGMAHFGVYASSPSVLRVQLACQGEVLYDQSAALDPENVLIDIVPLPINALPQDVALSVFSGERLLLSYTPLPGEKPAIPLPATPARPPEEIETVEELFLNGLHMEQYRHATFDPEPYFLEALRRDPGDIRCNNALGLLSLRRGLFAEARDYFLKAIQRLTLRNPNPYDGEPYYNLGLAYTFLGNHARAYDSFYKAVWNAAWQDAAYFALARLSSLNGDFQIAIEQLESCLARNGRHHKARHLKIALLRRTGQINAARRVIDLSLELDALEYGARWERFLLAGDPADETNLTVNPETILELAHDYVHAGLFDDALLLLDRMPQVHLLADYMRGWLLLTSGQEQAAQEELRRAASLPVDYVFPNCLEDMLILETVQRISSWDAHAPYLLGNFYYAHRRYADAIACWERSVELDAGLATVQRNLGLAYYNKLHDPVRALACLENAFALDSTDARIFFELDQLYKRLNRPPAERLDFLQQHLDLVAQRDDLVIEVISILNFLGCPREAFQLLIERNFHPWEGGEGKVTGQYVISLVEMARKEVAAGDARQANALLNQAQEFPPNLGEGKLFGAQENNIFYYLGCAYEALGEAVDAQASYERAARGLSEPTSALFYNDQPPEMIFYQGLALHKLGRHDEARSIFNRLADYGAAHLDDEVKIDYFAVSLPDFLVFDVDMSQRNRVHCHYMMGLGCLGLGELPAARKHFTAVLALDANYLGAELHSRLIFEG